MNRKQALVFGSCLILVLGMLWQCDPAEARRFGSGRSFGSGSSFKLFNKQTKPSVGTSRPATKQSPMTSARRGLGGGLLGGLLMGGLLGSLFMGGPFVGLNLLDFLIFGGIIFLLFKVFSRRRTVQPATPRHDAGQAPASRDFARDTQAFWDRLRSPDAASSGRQASRPGAAPGQTPDFDQDDFLQGAKAAYLRLQEAWDARELEDIKQFVTRQCYQEIASQMQDDPQPGQTEILLVNARIVEVKQDRQRDLVSVFFDVLMREDPASPQSKQVREVWTFVRETGQPEAHWKLDGIHQVDGTG